ncbi:uncharacterized protein LOC110982732, partial [Acanthaster planci]|uniref:Uncharacterized protein LOC110982732 n=1 Tax=Acanthaster planci TaxID=133434 RepID=A0A8B7YWJ5_ACAPL
FVLFCGNLEDVLQDSEVAVSTQITTVGKLLPSTLTSDDEPSTSQSALEERPVSPDLHVPATSGDESVLLEGWQKFWDEPPPQVQGMYSPNILWLKTDGPYGIFETPRTYTTANGEQAMRKVFKNKMDFNPPPLPTRVQGSLPSMLSFFTTPVFFWRPVGVLQVKLKCPNAKCPAPPGSYLSRSGYGNLARQVCGLRYTYTLLTERLKCSFCMQKRQQTTDEQQLQYRWHAYSPSLLANLAPAVRSMFPAILCGKRAVDKNVVTLLSDRLNSVSMAKVHRMIQQGHDEWYAERRDLYQTLLHQAHTAGNASGSQQGILQFIKPPGSYTAPIQQTPLPSPRVLRRAHLIMEMEKMPMYRASVLSVTGEILCIDGTKQILKKIYGDGRGTMQYVTSVLNEWGQFLTVVVVASESEDCYQQLARGLVSRFRRANAPAPKVLYADNNCCREGGTSWLESLFEAWVDKGLVIRLDIRHWLHRWDAVVIKQSHAKYGTFMSALAGAILAYNKDDMLLLIEAVRKGNEELYSQYTDEQMVSFVKPYQLKSYVRRVTRGIEVSCFHSVMFMFSIQQNDGCCQVVLVRNIASVGCYKLKGLECNC